MRRYRVYLSDAHDGTALYDTVDDVMNVILSLSLERNFLGAKKIQWMNVPTFEMLILHFRILDFADWTKN